jgi:hypothetical protein
MTVELDVAPLLPLGRRMPGEDLAPADGDVGFVEEEVLVEFALDTDPIVLAVPIG